MPPALYPRLLESSWHELAAPVRDMHLDGAALLYGSGFFRIRHGTSHLGCLLAWLMHMPSATEATNTRLVILPLGHGERWVRHFGDQYFVSTQREAFGGGLLERIGPLELRFRLEARDGALFYRQVGAALRLGPLRVPLPRRIAPRVEAKEEPGGADRTHVTVVVTAPWVGLLVSYEGHIKREED